MSICSCFYIFFDMSSTVIIIAHGAVKKFQLILGGRAMIP